MCCSRYKDTSTVTIHISRSYPKQATEPLSVPEPSRRALPVNRVNIALCPQAERSAWRRALVPRTMELNERVPHLLVLKEYGSGMPSMDASMSFSASSVAYTDETGAPDQNPWKLDTWLATRHSRMDHFSFQQFITPKSNRVGINPLVFSAKQLRGRAGLVIILCVHY